MVAVMVVSEAVVTRRWWVVVAATAVAAAVLKEHCSSRKAPRNYRVRQGLPPGARTSD